MKQPSKLVTAILFIALAATITLAVLYSSTGDPKKLVWNDFGLNKIVVSDLDGSNQISYQDPKLMLAPKRLAVYAPEKAVFYTSPYLDKILRLNLIDGTVTEVISTGPQKPVAASMVTAIAIEETSKKIYWNDAASKTIYSANLDGTECKALIKDAGHVRDIFLDSRSSKIYWTDNITRKERIVRANYDGTGIEVVRQLENGTPGAIAINPHNGDIYWSDAFIKAIPIQKIDSNGKHIKTIHDSEKGTDGTLIDATNLHLYWVETGYREPQRILRSNLDGSNVIEIHSQPKGSLADLEFIPETGPNRIIQASLITLAIGLFAYFSLRLHRHWKASH